jgi:hypothetical protein
MIIYTKASNEISTDWNNPKMLDQTPVLPLTPFTLLAVTHQLSGLNDLERSLGAELLTLCMRESHVTITIKSRYHRYSLGDLVGSHGFHRVMLLLRVAEAQVARKIDETYQNFTSSTPPLPPCQV